MSIVKVKDFAVVGPNGMERLYCKICGTIIGEKTIRPIERTLTPDGRLVERNVEVFSRNDLFTEMKIAYDNGSAHVTVGCRNCFTNLKFTPEDLQEITEVDEKDLGLPHRNGYPVGVVQVKVGGGIV